MNRGMITPILLGILVPLGWWGACLVLIPEPQSAKWVTACVWSSIIGGALVGALGIQRVAEAAPISIFKPGAVIFAGVIPAIALLCGMAAGTTGGPGPQNAGGASTSSTPTTPDELEVAMKREGVWHRWDPGHSEATCGPGTFAVGFILPPTTTKTWCRFTGLSPDNDVSLVDGYKYRLPPELLVARPTLAAHSGQEVESDIFAIKGDNQGQLAETFSGQREGWASDGNVTLMYLTSAKPTTVGVEYTLRGTRTWLVQVDRQGAASFTVPPGNWKYFWVVPLRSQEHLARFGDTKVSPEGVAVNLAAISAEKVAYFRHHTLAGVPYRGLYWQIGSDPARPLQQPVTLAQGDVLADTRIVLGMNVLPEDLPDQPAQFLVGMSQ